MLSYVMTRKSDLFLCRNFWWHKVDQGGKESLSAPTILNIITYALTIL